jgi:hypothetical protein
VCLVNTSRGDDELDGLVQTSLFAACTGLAYTLSAAFRLEAYLGALFPLPLVLSAARGPPAAVWRTLRATALLLLLLAGPVRACTYVLLHGSLGAAMALAWAARWPWLWSVPVAACVRTAGALASLAVSSLLLRDNIAALVIAQLHAALDQAASLVGVTSPLTPAWVAGLALALLLVNSLTYTLLLHVLYAILMLGSDASTSFGQTPAALRRALTVELKTSS